MKILEVDFFGDQGGGLNFLKLGSEFFFMLHWQTFLINVIKMLFLWKTIELGYIKYELGGELFLHAFDKLLFL